MKVLKKRINDYLAKHNIKRKVIAVRRFLTAPKEKMPSEKQMRIAGLAGAFLLGGGTCLAVCKTGKKRASGILIGGMGAGILCGLHYVRANRSKRGKQK